MKKRRYAGRNLVIFGALALILWAGFESYVRLDMLRWTFEGVYKLCQNEHIPLLRALSYFDSQMYVLVGYLTVTALVGLVALILHNRPKACYFLVPAMLAIGAYGTFQLGLFSPNIFSSIQGLKLIPMTLIACGSVVNLCQYHHRKRHRRQSPKHSAHTNTRQAA